MLLAALVLFATCAVPVDAQRGRAKPRQDAVTVTAYCLEGETASGEQTRRGIAAADPAIYPLGTILQIDGLKRHNGRYDVQDTGRAVKGNTVDIFIPDCAAARRFGRQEGRARVIRVGKG